ncbi:MAG: DUF2778 domain-containing protein [Hyphomicrobiales bacterium]|nr:DUF2778 domain-containing protein [Hyphomicrobiales bacterium]
MTFSSVQRSISHEHRHKTSANHARARRHLAGIACTCVALACAWIVWANPHGTVTVPPPDNPPSPTAVAPARVTQSSVAIAYAKLSAAMRRYTEESVKADALLVLLDPRFLTGSNPATFSKNAAAGANGAAAGLSRLATGLEQGISSTVSRAHRLAQNAASTLPTGSLHKLTTSVRDRIATEKPTIFDRLFGKPASTVTLAYAAPEGDLDIGRSLGHGRYDRQTAVYDISAHAVYLPDGTVLEAHSGRGSSLDDPRYVDQRNRGATPPDVYDLQLREGLFHGVQALRLIPVDSSKVFGRSGFLAHTYMLGPNGDSFGCVSFKDYPAFLRAYLDHKIKRLVVVAGPV